MNDIRARLLKQHVITPDDIEEAMELYDQLKQSFDTLLADHQRLLARFVGLRRAAAPIVDTFETYGASQENTMNPLSFSEWCTMWMDAESLEKSMTELTKEHNTRD